VHQLALETAHYATLMRPTPIPGVDATHGRATSHESTNNLTLMPSA